MDPNVTAPTEARTPYRRACHVQEAVELALGEGGPLRGELAEAPERLTCAAGKPSRGSASRPAIPEPVQRDGQVDW